MRDEGTRVAGAVAREKRRMYRADEDWGKPVPGWGDPRARAYMVGLAPAAHGGNRTARVFTKYRTQLRYFCLVYPACGR